MPKVKSAKHSREHSQRCQQGQGAISATILVTLVSYIIGIMFEKSLGQHILRNPLIISSMVEKVCHYKSL